jgi:hypothetical protein
MGQYHSLFNLDKLEVVNPHNLGFGAKQREHSGYGGGSLADILYVLCAYKESRGGGDWANDNSEKTGMFSEIENGVFKGRWHGDRVAVIGDYYEESDLPAGWSEALSDIGEPTKFKDISDEIRPFVNKLFNEDGKYDYRNLSQQLADYAEVK